MSQDEILSNKQEVFVQHLLSGMSPAEAANKVGASRATAYRWMENPVVQRLLQTGKEEISHDVRATIAKGFAALTEKAMKALEESLDCEAPAVRLNAAKLVLERVSPAEQLPQTTEVTIPGGIVIDPSKLNNEQLTLLQQWIAPTPEEDKLRLVK